MRKIVAVAKNYDKWKVGNDHLNSANCLFVIWLVGKENHRIVKDEVKRVLAKSLTTCYKIIFSFLKNAVCGQSTGMFRPTKPVTLHSPSLGGEILRKG